MEQGGEAGQFLSESLSKWGKVWTLLVAMTIKRKEWWNTTLCNDSQDMKGEGITEVSRVTSFLDLVATAWISVSSTSDDTINRKRRAYWRVV